MSRRDAHPKAEARACKQQRREATAWSAQFCCREEHPRCTIEGPRTEQSPTQGADRRSRYLPYRQMLQLGCVPGDAHKRTEHGTAEPRPCEKDSFRTQLRTTPNARTRRHGRDARHEGFHTRLFAVMQSFFCTVEECPSTHSTWRG